MPWECEVIGCPGSHEQNPGRCPDCGGPVVQVEDDPTVLVDFLAALYRSPERARPELDQLQAEADASGRTLNEVLLWDAAADMELDAMLDRDDQGGE